MLNKRQAIIPNAIDGKLRVQDRASERASERLRDQFIEEIKDWNSPRQKKPCS